MIDLLRGSAQGNALLLRIIGLLGAVLGIVSHFGVWHSINAGTSNVVESNGMQDGGPIGLAIIGLYLLLVLLNSSYSLLLALAFVPYLLEMLFGVNLLRYMPLDSTKLGPSLYMYLPTAAVCMLVGAFGPIVASLQRPR